MFIPPPPNHLTIMKMYPHIIASLNRTLWGAMPETVEAIQDVLNAAMQGRIEAEFPDADQSQALVTHSADALAMFGEPDEPEEEKPYKVINRTAIVPAFGVIGKHLSRMQILCGGLDLDTLCGHLKQAVDDPFVDQVILWFNSPGGTVTGTPEAARFINRLSEVKSVYAYSDRLMCSCAYWLASQCTQVFAAPSAMIGNVGVFMTWLDRSAQAAKEGVKLEVIKAGEYKNIPHPLEKLSKEARQHLTDQITATRAQFFSAITAMRPEIKDEDAQGQCWSWDEQTTRHFADAQYDSIGDLISAISSAV